MQVLTDQDVLQYPKKQVVELMHQAVLAAENNQLESPARVSAADLTFTAGATSEVFGFRAYHTKDWPHHEQLVAVWDASGQIVGVVTGTEIGPLRTSALGVVATQAMALRQASCLGLIGSGKQAKAHALTLAAVRPLSQVLVYSRTESNRQKLVQELSDAGLPARETQSAREVCEASDLLTLATNSATPVIESRWIQTGTHVCTLGPKQKHRHEFPADLTQNAAHVVTDSLAQWQSYSGGHLLENETARSLGDYLQTPPVRQDHEISVFLSVGLAGTEVMLARALLSVTSE